MHFELWTLDKNLTWIKHSEYETYQEAFVQKKSQQKKSENPFEIREVSDDVSTGT